MEPPVGVLLLAGGSGSRVGADVNKVYVPVAGRPILAYSLETILACRFVRVAVLVVRAGDETTAGALVDAASDPRILTVIGGHTRAASEQAGLEALAPAIEAGDITVVAIHDGARPFATTALFARVVAAAAERGGAVPVLPVTEGLYVVAAGRLQALDPGSTSRVQTPQAFRAGPLLGAYRQAVVAGFAGVDTAETVERFSDLVVVTVPGEPDNIKLTFSGDLARADALASRPTGDRSRR